MESARQLQCKPLRELEKSRWCKNNEKQWKNNGKNNAKNNGIPARADP
jgi:hypothetical protein